MTGPARLEVGLDLAVAALRDMMRSTSYVHCIWGMDGLFVGILKLGPESGVTSRNGCFLFFFCFYSEGNNSPFFCCSPSFTLVWIGNDFCREIPWAFIVLYEETVGRFGERLGI